MKYKYYYETPENLSNIVILSDGEYITDLVFEGSQDEKELSSKEHLTNDKVFTDVIKWLDEYFSGKVPSISVKYKDSYKSEFNKEVINIIKSIPYGKTMTYGEIASIIASKRDIKRMSSQAVGNACHSNKVCLIVPCHRVLGKNMKLTGYGGGLSNKKALLKIEGVL